MFYPFKIKPIVWIMMLNFIWQIWSFVKIESSSSELYPSIISMRVMLKCLKLSLKPSGNLSIRKHF